MATICQVGCALPKHNQSQQPQAATRHTGKKMTARRAAYEALRLEQGGAYANLALKEVLEGQDTPREERAFATALFYAVLEHRLTLDFYLSSWLAKRPALPIRCVLWLGAAQMLYMDVPARAAVDESVKLCKQIGKNAQAGLVNAVLRKLEQNQHALPQPKGSPAQKLSITHSCPLWLVERLLALLDEQQTQAFLSQSGARRGVCVRANPLQMSSATLDEEFKRAGVASVPGQWLPQARYLQGGGDMAALPWFVSGALAVQSESSMLVGQVLGAGAGMRVLDACAAPGGKTAYIAAEMGQGELWAWDDHAHRVALIRQTCARLHADFVQAEEQDASLLRPEQMNRFDRVLVDAPCSGLGVLRSKPDIRYRQSPQALQNLVALQRRILSTCAQYVKPGGVLLYSTCTVLPEENCEQVQAFLQEHTDFVLDMPVGLLPQGLERQQSQEGMLQLWPQRDGIDGFFLARMRRQAPAG